MSSYSWCRVVHNKDQLKIICWNNKKLPNEYKTVIFVERLEIRRYPSYWKWNSNKFDKDMFLIYIFGQVMLRKVFDSP